MIKQHQYACVDIGGTNVRFAMIHKNKTIFFKKFLVDPNNPKKTLKPVFQLLKQYEITTLGIACPGPADYEKGIIKNPPNLTGWHNLDLKQLFLNNTNVIHFVFENDANAAAYAVHFHFKQTKKDITQFFTISTGLGAGLIYQNEIFGGYNHLAQEVACAPLAPFKAHDVWNLSEHALELFASGSGMVKRASTLGLKGIDTKWLFNNYEIDQIAHQVIDEAIATLANLFAVSMAFFAPNLIVVGGSVAINNQWFVKKAFDTAKDLTWSNQYYQTRLEFDILNDDVVLLGLDYLIRAKF